MWKGKCRTAWIPCTMRPPTWPNAVNRPKDISFVIDQLEKLDGQLRPAAGDGGPEAHRHGRPFLRRLHDAGRLPARSPGGWAMLSLGDPRVKAAVPMSGSVPKRRDKLDQAFGVDQDPLPAHDGHAGRQPRSARPRPPIGVCRSITCTWPTNIW